jgi:DNA-binding IclR family transcriptional regulator
MTGRKTRSARSSPRLDYSAPALEKGMDIIELLAAADSGLTVSEIAQRLDRRMSELFRIIIVLERRGWLQKDTDSSRYHVAYHVLKLAHRGTPAQTLSRAAAPVMHDLSNRINQSCHLVIRAGAQGLVILRQENPRRHANLSVRLGAVIDLATSASGHVLLAHLATDARDALMPELPRPRSLTREKLERVFTRVRQRGYEQIQSPITAGVTDISCPIFGFDGQVAAALTIPYLHARDSSLPTTVQQTRGLIAEAARRISLSFGSVH